MKKKSKYEPCVTCGGKRYGHTTGNQCWDCSGK